MDNRKYLFTSESVSEGHPDKVADQISDAVLDACIGGDPESRVACETLTTTGMVYVGGEITTDTYVDVQSIARGVAKKIGYDRAEYGDDALRYNHRRRYCTRIVAQSARVGGPKIFQLHHR